MPEAERQLDEMIPFLQDPGTGNPLAPDEGSLVDTVTGERFMIRDGIPVMLRQEDVFGWNRKQQRGYDLGSHLYDLLYMFSLSKRWLSEIAGIMEVRTGDCVLETSVGTGQQLKNLRSKGVDARFFGNDISFGMLRRCKRNLRKWRLGAGLVQGNAEALPFGDQLFDVVFHVGGFNFFNHKQKAIDEMIRVARPGANLYIIDESDSAIRKGRSLISRVVRRFLPAPEVFTPPAGLIPETMLDLKQKELLKGHFWLVSFRKPGG